MDSETWNFFSLFNKIGSSSDEDEDFAPDFEASEQNEVSNSIFNIMQDIDEELFSKSNYKEGKAPKVPRKEVYDLVIDNINNDGKL